MMPKPPSWAAADDVVTVIGGKTTWERGAVSKSSMVRAGLAARVAELGGYSSPGGSPRGAVLVLFRRGAAARPGASSGADQRGLGGARGGWPPPGGPVWPRAGGGEPPGPVSAPVPPAASTPASMAGSASCLAATYIDRYSLADDSR